jgi:YD repeat-containing protein
MATTALYNFFTGSLDEVRLYDRALSASEVSQLYTNPAGSSSTTVQDLRYHYDPAGNVSQIVDAVHGNQTFGYDDLDRLTSAAGAYGTLTYTYNEIGNMTFNSQVGNYAYPPSGPTSVRPHAVSTAGSSSYSYDNNGNMTSGAGRTIDYDV